MSQTFLIVDDDVGSATLMKTCLCWFLGIPEHQIIEYYRSTDALNYLTENHIDVLITDYCMPEIDGLTLIKKAREIHPEIVTILVSASADLDHDAKVHATSPDGLLSKPFEIERFANLVSGITRAPALTQATLLPEIIDTDPASSAPMVKG